VDAVCEEVTVTMSDVPKLPECTVKIKEEEIAPAEVLKLGVEVWKKTVDVQEHFNDIALRLRSMAITVLVGALGASFYVAKDAGYWVSLGIVVMGGFAWLAFFVMDRYWYHLFLRAAGIHAGKIEARFKSILPEMALSTAISNESKAVKIAFFPGTYSSSQRLAFFYFLGLIVLMIAAAIFVVALLIGSPTRKQATPANQGLTPPPTYNTTPTTSPLRAPPPTQPPPPARQPWPSAPASAPASQPSPAKP
jgi:hypothetical protein